MFPHLGNILPVGMQGAEVEGVGRSSHLNAVIVAQAAGEVMAGGG